MCSSINNNEIIVKSEILISDILNDNEKTNKKFVNGIIDMPDMNNRKRFEIMMFKLDEYTLLLKPKKKYKCMVFEELFGFGYECSGFDINKIIKIKMNK